MSGRLRNPAHGRAFALGIEGEKIYRRPRVKALVEDNVREGTVEPATLARIVAALPEYLQDAVRWGYLTGWRRGAVCTLGWEAVDRATGRVYLRRASSKNREPYTIPLSDDLSGIIERRWQARVVPRRREAPFISPLVFHRKGRPLGDFRKSWARACTKAGVRATLFHDLRRSCAVNPERAGVPATVGKAITGHEATSMWERYRIVGERDVARALHAVQQHVREAAREGARRATS